MLEFFRTGNICNLLSIYIAAISVHETKADGPDQPLDIISQNLEFLQAVGFPRQSCRCGGGHHAYDLVRSPNTSLIGFYHTFEQDHQIYNRVMAEQMSFIESSGLMDMVQKIHLTYVGPQNHSLRMPTKSDKYLVHMSTIGMEERSLKLLHNHCVSNPQLSLIHI